MEQEKQCSVPGCENVAEVQCTITSQNGFCPGDFCIYHYGQIHLPDDERDEVDQVLGRPLFEKGKPMNDVTINNLNDLQRFNQSLPDGTRSDGIPSDLEAGNFDEASMQLPSGEEFTVRYTGPVADGYVER